MFNLEQSVAEWRRQMRAAGVKNPDVLDELESHLREDVERQARPGVNLEKAFEISVQCVGQPTALHNEFAKGGTTIQERTKHFILTLTGIQNPQLASNMNASNLNLNLEPRWATYLKATAFLLPAAFVWLFSVVFVLPKLNEVCQAAGTTVFNFQHAPAIFRMSATIGQVMVFLTAHGFLISGAIVFALMLLEWRSSGWPRFRRTTLGAGVFLFNFAVLLSMALMVIGAVLAALPLLHHVK